jgi:hypothetical protein
MHKDDALDRPTNAMLLVLILEPQEPRSYRWILFRLGVLDTVDGRVTTVSRRFGQVRRWTTDSKLKRERGGLGEQAASES